MGFRGPPRPHVTVHVATSLDGRIAREGATTALSTDEGRRSAHRARAASDAVLVGSATIRIDDPRLTVREAEGRDPLRVVLASRLDLPPNARIFADNRVLVIGIEAAARAGGAGQAPPKLNGEITLVMACAAGMVALAPALEVLAGRGVERLLVEGGSRVLTSFFRENLVDRVEIEVATTLLGDPGTPLVGILGQPPRLRNVEVERLGTNVLIRGDV